MVSTRLVATLTPQVLANSSIARSARALFQRSSGRLNFAIQSPLAVLDDGFRTRTTHRGADQHQVLDLAASPVLTSSSRIYASAIS
jgi:hypothetical protein